MNVFEELVTELQEANLLEKTVLSRDDDGHGLGAGDPERLRASDDFEVEFESEIEDNTTPPSATVSEPLPAKPSNGKEFYQKRAMGEVSNLQMVEHVLTGVEREYMRVKPSTFDDFNVKKSLNAFLKLTETENSAEHQEAEFALMQETESWCSALAARDKKISVGNLRMYCENSRPALSSQAMVALARFYRNLPHSEEVRGKFDFVITRLFSRAVEDEKRTALFTREESLNHIKMLYREWSSISLYAADDDDSKVTLTAMSFDEFVVEAENASRFDELIESDFFGRLRLFKESISELFYAPPVTAAAIEANIKIGNAYVNLIQLEREKLDASAIQTKFAEIPESLISEAAARTLDLASLLKLHHDEAEARAAREEAAEEEVPAEEPKTEIYRTVVEPEKKKEREYPPIIAAAIGQLKKVNKIFLGCSIALILASIAIYIWANFFVSDDVQITQVRSVEVDRSAVGEWAKIGKVSGENFYLVLKPGFETLSKDKQKEVLQKGYQMAQELKCKQVTLLGKDGQAVGYASAARSELTTQ